MIVDDPSHPDLDQVRVLRSPDAVLRRAGLVVVEGITIVDSLLRQGWSFHRLVVTPAMWQRLAPLLPPDSAIVTVVDPATLSAAAGFDVHRGVLGFLREPAGVPWQELAHRARTITVVEGVNDAENLGALVRSAWALGSDALLLDPTTLDPYGRRVVRVSMGAALHLPLARLDAWPHGLGALRAQGVTVVALTPRADAVPLSAVDLPPHGRVALMVGAEGPGLTDDALRHVDVAVRIPMRSGVDSLNVAHAAAIALAALDRASTITP